MGASEPAGAGVQAAASGEFLLRGSMVDRYVILGLLGRGGMGVVYAAYDPELDRRVALKLLRTQKLHPNDLSQGRIRMLREARALAKLSHPNVVALYDAGEYEADIYLAMEMATGETLSAWLASKPRAWREVVEVFIQAGQGLAAAHFTGLVHRDFKPANVVVGEDGRVRVLDFGLARLMTQADVTDEDASLDPMARSVPAHVSSADGISSLEHSLTQTGMLVGTPAYMAPEVALGKTADPLSDQFSFCVTLYEALYGQRPFTGTTRKDVVKAILSGRVEATPRDREVPAWIRRVVLRGLSRRPRDRWPSIDVLLAELRADPDRARRRWSGVAAVFALGVTTAYGIAAIGEDPAQCAGADSKVAAVWNASSQQATKAAFERVGISYGVDTWSRVEANVGGYVDEWSQMHKDACEATHLRHEQSEAMLDRRMVCLSEKLDELDALLAIFREADGEVVENAVKAVSELPTLSECADVQRLQLQVAPPATEQQREVVDAVRERLARGRALQTAGRYELALDVVEKALTDSRSAKYQPLVAAAQYHVGLMQERMGKYEDAAENLAEAGWLAQSNHDDEILALAQIRLTHVVGYELSRLDDGLRWARHADAAITRLGRPKELEADLLNVLGTLHARREAYQEATASYLRAIELREHTRGVDHLSTAKSWGNLALVMSAQDRHEEALEYGQRAVEIRRRSLGPGHPDVAISFSNLAFAEASAGKDRIARTHLEQAVEIFEKTLGPDHAHLATAFNSLGSIATRMGDDEAALRHFQRALAIRERSLGSDHPRVGTALTNLAAVLLQQGRLEQAEDYLTRGRAIVEKSLGPEHSTSGQVLEVVAGLHMARGEHDQAVEVLQRALASMEKGLGPESSEIAPVLVALGHALAAVERTDEARDVLERALALPLGRDGRFVRGEGLFALARLLHADAHQQSRALELAEQAALLYRDGGVAHADDVEAVESWLAATKSGHGTRRPGNGRGSSR